MSWRRLCIVLLVLAGGACGAYPEREGAQRGQPAGAGSPQDAAAHLIYGLATALVVAEFTRQAWRPTTWRRVG
jgi:hypothetical protein